MKMSIIFESLSNLFIYFKHVMTESFGNIIGRLSTSSKKTIRKYEHINRKLIKAEFALRFNEQCFIENTLPIYTNIYIYIYIHEKIQLSPLHMILDEITKRKISFGP